MPRRQDAVWNEFTATNVDGRRSAHAECKFCHETFSSVVQRMKKHVVHCQAAPSEIRALYSSSSSSAISSGVSSSASSCSQPGKKQKLVQSTLSLHPPVNTMKQQEIENACCKAFISCNIAWNAIEDPYLKEFLSMLRPNFKCKSRKVYSNSILKRVCDIECRKDELMLSEARFITLICDGKTDISKRNVTNWIATDTNGLSVLYDFTTGSLAKDGASICDELMQIGKALQEKTAAVLSFVSDSAGSYVKARELLKLNSESPFQFVGPCLAHQSNLILKDFLQSSQDIQDLLSKVALNKSVALHTAISQQLGLETFSLPQPTLTRWYSIALTVKKLSKLKVAIKTTVSQEEEKPYLRRSKGFQKFKTIIFDDTFWNDISAFDALVQPFVFIQALSEMRQISSGMIVVAWFWLMILIMKTPRLQEYTKQRNLEKFNHRIYKYIEPYQLIPVLVDINVKGDGLTASARRKLNILFQKTVLSDIDRSPEAYIKFKESQLRTQYIQQEIEQFCEGRGDFDDQEAYGSNAIGYWETLSDKVISRVALMVLHTVSHVADCERTWSMHGLVHTKTRNRLSTDSVSKILKVRHALGRDKAKAKSMIDVRKKYSKLLMDSNENIAMDILFGPPLESSNVTADRGAAMISSSHQHPYHSAVDESEDAALDQLEEMSELNLAQRVLDLLRNDENDEAIDSDEDEISDHSLEFSFDTWVDDATSNELSTCFLNFFSGVACETIDLSDD